MMPYPAQLAGRWSARCAGDVARGMGA